MVHACLGLVPAVAPWQACRLHCGRERAALVHGHGTRPPWGPCYVYGGRDAVPAPARTT